MDRWSEAPPLEISPDTQKEKKKELGNLLFYEMEDAKSINILRKNQWVDLKISVDDALHRCGDRLSRLERDDVPVDWESTERERRSHSDLHSVCHHERPYKIYYIFMKSATNQSIFKIFSQEYPKVNEDNDIHDRWDVRRFSPWRVWGPFVRRRDVKWPIRPWEFVSAPSDRPRGEPSCVRGATSIDLDNQSKRLLEQGYEATISRKKEKDK